MSSPQSNNLIELQDEVMSNCDHTIDYEVAELLKDGKCYAQYSGWNFCGKVYWDIPKQKFVCEVWRYHICEEIIKYTTLELIMKNVCENYGYK